MSDTETDDDDYREQQRNAKKEAADAKKAELKAKKEAMQLAHFEKMQLEAHKAEMNSVDGGGGKAKKMRRSRRKSLRKTRQRNRKRHGRKSRRRL